LLEEQKLFPAVQQFTPELNNLTDQLLHEHRQMEQMVSYIEKTNGADPLQLHELGLLLEQHIRTEERVLLEKLQEKLPQEVLDKLAEVL
ncbi:MAG: hemerythrin domain-containing protein, partial [Hymenobacteraceae bacterium]|nr:hemerythrin domain-containing protein [Hymenobacteraceae bacterium]